MGRGKTSDKKQHKGNEISHTINYKGANISKLG
jgi:hypothetical protein